jgi:glucose-1-phosphate thymidylyltransferase
VAIAETRGVRGIILAGGTGSRLHPITLGVSKQLVPVYDKPMVYYPLSTLLLSGIQDILVVTTPQDVDQFSRLLGDGSRFGVSISYKVQPSPDGLAQAFILGEDHIGSDTAALVLGDNIFYGQGMGSRLRQYRELQGGVVFGYWVDDPTAYGVVEFDADGRVVSLEEKPQQPKSHYAVPGLYFYDNDVVEIAKSLKPSPRGELEISPISEGVICRSSFFLEGLPGSIPGHSTRWRKRRTSSARCRSARGCPSGVPKRSPGAWASSQTMNSAHAPSHSSRADTADTSSRLSSRALRGDR